MLKGFSTFAIVQLTLASAFSAEPLRLRQVLESALSKADKDGSTEAIAQAQLEYLRSLNRVKVDLRPQAGMFTFSQPNLVGTTAGAGVVVSRRTAPGLGVMQSAELDVLSAQIARKRAILHKEVETAKLFFDLLAKQETAQRACAALDESRRRQGDMAKLVKTAKLTAVDMVRFEEQTLQQQADCIDADTQRKLASVLVATAMGAPDQSGELRVADVDLAMAGSGRPLPSSDKLYEVAMTFRTEPKMIEEQIAAAKPKIPTPYQFRPESVSAGFYRIQDARSFGSSAVPSYLLGGNTVRAEATWNIGLRKTGEQAAAGDVVDAKVHGLEAQLNTLRDEIRNELAAIRVLAAASLEKLPVARRRVELLSRGRNLVATRFQSGLASSSGVFDAEQESMRAEAGLTQATCDLKASTYIMLTLAGIQDKTVAEQDRLLGYTQAAISGGQ
jgi:outer membrane protein TolC